MIGILVLPVKHGVCAVITGFIRHLKGMGRAGVVIEIAVAVIQAEKIEQVIVNPGFEIRQGKLFRLRQGFQMVFGLFAIRLIGKFLQLSKPLPGSRVIGVFPQGLPQLFPCFAGLRGKSCQPVAGRLGRGLLHACQGLFYHRPEGIFSFTVT